MPTKHLIAHITTIKLILFTIISLKTNIYINIFFYSKYFSISLKHRIIKLSLGKNEHCYINIMIINLSITKHQNKIIHVVSFYLKQKL
jgi:hypothetical protein